MKNRHSATADATSKAIAAATTVSSLTALVVVAAFGAMVGNAQASILPAVVGDATMAIGVVRVFSGDGVARLIERGAAIREGDRIETDVGGHLHLRFVDGGRLSVRPSSRLTIENYSHSDRQNTLSAIKFRLDEGVVRSITGAWGEAARDRFRLNTPVAAIGVKGTDFVVSADSTKTLAQVYSGAIVLAPLAQGCQGTLGPCQNGFEKQLTGAMTGKMVALYNEQTTPQIVASPEFLAQATTRRAEAIAATRNDPQRQTQGADAGGATVTASAAPSTSSSPSGSSSASSSSTVAASGGNVNAGANSGANASANVNAGAGNPTAQLAAASTQQSAAVSLLQAAALAQAATGAPVVVPPPVPELPAVVTQLAWARAPWIVASTSDALAVAFAVATLNGRQNTVGTGAYTLFRDPSATNLMVATEASAKFRLAGGSATLAMAEGRLLEAARVDSGTLRVDFSRATFDTTMTVSSPTLGTDNVAASGFVQPNGFLTGQGGNMSVVGALSLDTKEAGYAFSKDYPVGNLSGITLWGR